MKQNEDETFNRLRRVPFDTMVDNTCIDIWGEPAHPLHRKIVIEFWSKELGLPTQEWIEIYQEMGWDWQDLQAEAKQRHKEAENGNVGS